MPALSPSLESESLHKTKSYKARKGRITEKKNANKKLGDTELVSKAREEWGILKKESGHDGKAFLIIPLILTIFIDL